VITILVVAQLTIIASGPPLKPTDAAATLRRASPDLDLSRGLFRLDDLPLVINVSPPASSRQAPGLVVPRVAVPPRPEPPSITFGLPHGWWRAPRTQSGETPRRHRSR
jgi:hypothetical protein